MTTTLSDKELAELQDLSTSMDRKQVEAHLAEQDVASCGCSSPT